MKSSINQAGLLISKAHLGGRCPYSANPSTWGQESERYKVYPSRVRCSYASKYKAIRKPTCGCTACETKWAEKQGGQS